MTDLPAIAIAGASGRMGQMLIRIVDASGKARVAAALERHGHPWIGQDLGEAMGMAANGITVADDPLDALADVRAVLDFTAPEATVDLADMAAQARIVHVIGTTGFRPEHLKRIAAAARHAVIVRAGNMSLGVNLLVELTRQVAASLGPDYDIEVIEAHHRGKIDAPSGTALMLGAAAARGRGATLEEMRLPAREGMTGARDPGRIGFASIRGGDIVGEHDVIFAGDGERMILRHIATDRAVFARGALAAALWGMDKKPGEYAMKDVLGL